jgi:nucleotide-binding universal stress UspA family protein
VKKIEKILVPVDFSGNTDKIIQYAKMIAEQFSAKIDVLFVVQELDEYSGFFIPHIPLTNFKDEMHQSASLKMRKFIDDTFEQTKLYNNSKVLTGDITDQINNYIQENDIDIVIMGTHGYKGVEKLLFGSIAERVVKTSPCPVLTINPYKVRGN